MPPDLLSFDLDGTLVDTAGEIAEAVNLALEAHAIPRRPVAEITLLIGAGTAALMQRLHGRLREEGRADAALAPLPELLRTLDACYRRTTGTLARPYPGCTDALQRLRVAGVRLACTTNKELRHAHAVLRATGLHGLFDLVVGGDSLPERKPHASVLRHVVSVLGGTVQRTVHVGDSETDVLAARNAGVAAWAVPYGYNGGVPIVACAPDRIFDDLQSVADHALALRGSTAAAPAGAGPLS